MSEQTNYCTLKGLGWAFLIIAFFIVVVPVLLVDNAKYCKQSIVPCYPWTVPDEW
tara:strand:- start:177 stop:341 length:165 start_codon:yes stop_codon:yes gene_type:complete